MSCSDHEFAYMKLHQNHMIYVCTKCSEVFRDKDHWNTINDPMVLEPFNKEKAIDEGLVKPDRSKCILTFNEDGSIQNVR